MDRQAILNVKDLSNIKKIIEKRKFNSEFINEDLYCVLKSIDYSIFA